MSHRGKESDYTREYRARTNTKRRTLDLQLSGDTFVASDAFESCGARGGHVIRPSADPLRLRSEDFALSFSAFSAARGRIYAWLGEFHAGRTVARRNISELLWSCQPSKFYCLSRCIPRNALIATCILLIPLTVHSPCAVRPPCRYESGIQEDPR